MSFSFKKWNGFDPSYKPSKLDSKQGYGIEKEQYKILEFYPPSYSDIGKKARDLFNSGYYFGVLSLDFKTRSNNNVEIASSWDESMDESRLYGTVEAKYQLAEYNLALTDRLNKNCFLNTELSYKSKLLDGLALSFGGAFSPRSGLKLGHIKADWSSRHCSANSFIEIGRNILCLTSSLVLGCRGVFGGFHWRYDIHGDKTADLNFAVGYSNDEFNLCTCVNNGNECGGSIYHKVAPEVEVGIDMKWWTKGREPLYGVAGRYELDKNVSIRGKINNNSELGFSYEQKLSEGIALTMSTLFDLRNIPFGAHKFGLALRLEL